MIRKLNTGVRISFCLTFLLSIFINSTFGNLQNLKSYNLTLVRAKTRTIYSPEEKILINKLREIAGDEIILNFMKTDKYLVKWIRDNGNDPKKAYTKLSLYLKHRKEKNIDRIVEEDFRILERTYLFEILGFDNQGCGIIGLGVGTYNIRRAVLGGNEKVNKLYRFLEYVFETNAYVIRESECEFGIAIANLNGYSNRESGCLGCIPFYIRFVNVLNEFYPQILKKFIIINTPRVFETLLNKVLIPLLSGYNSKIYQIFSSDRSEFSPVVTNGTNPKIIPRELGGTRKTPLQYNKIHIPLSKIN